MYLELLRKTIEESQYMVCLVGTVMQEENGYPNLRDSLKAYEIEESYGYTPDELFSSVFYATRPEQFYDYYRNEYLSVTDIKPDCGFQALAKLEQCGKLKCSITRSVFDLPRRAGCKKVLNLHGSVFENRCPRCGEQFSIEFMKHEKHLPICPKCKVAVRPQVSLIGEMLDNRLVSNSTSEVARADILLILGANLKSYLCETLIPYFNGKKVVIIRSEEHYTDHLADLVIYDQVKNVLPKIL